MKKLIRNLIIGCVLTLGIVLLKNSLTQYIKNPNFGMQAVIEQGSVENLFIGSSLFRQGLDILTIEEKLGKNSYIVTYNGNQPVLMEKELEYMLDQGVEIKTLYLDMYSYTAAADPWFSDTKILWDVNLPFKIEIWRLMQKYSNANFKDFYEMFVLANNEYLFNYPISYPLVSGGFYKGGNARDTEGSSKEALDKKPTVGHRNGILAIQADAYKKIEELCRENGIRLIFVEVPKYVKMAQDPDYQQLNEQVISVLEEIEAEYVLAGQLDFDSENAEYFQDLMHLSTAGRKKFTENLIQVIEKEDKNTYTESGR